MRELKNVVLEITNRCNLHCSHCCTDSGKEQENQLTDSEIYSIIDQLFEMKVQRLGITGGEPFCDQHLLDYLAYAKERIPVISIATNGYYINEQMISKLKSLGVHKFAISLDGMKEYHNQLRGSHNSFEKAITAIQLLVKANMEVKVRSVVNKENRESILNLIKITNELGVKRHEIMPVCPLGRADEKMCLESKEYYEFLKDVIVTIQNLEPIKIMYQLKPVFQEQDLFLGVPNEIREKSLAYRCDAFDDSLQITSVGDVIGCSFVRTSVGNIRFHSLQKLWNFPQTLQLYHLIHDQNKTGRCKDCLRNELCNGGCFANQNEEQTDRYCFVRRLKNVL